MSKAKEVIQLLEMNRGAWVYLVRTRYLGGALGEYTKLYIARKLDIKDYWSNEVSRILSKVSEYMNKEEVAVKGDRNKMLKEAYKDALLDQYQVTSAKNELMIMFGSKKKQIKSLDLKSQELLPEMVREFLPQYSNILK